MWPTFGSFKTQSLLSWLESYKQINSIQILLILCLTSPVGHVVTMALNLFGHESCPTRAELVEFMDFWFL